MRRTTLKISLAVGDYLVMFVSLVLVLYIRYSAEGNLRLEQHVAPFSVIFALWVLFFYIFELYDINAPFNHRNFLYAMLINVGGAGLTFYLLSDIVDISPRRNLALVAAGFVVLFYSWRFIFNRIIDTVGWTRNVAVIGSDEHSLTLVSRIDAERRQGFRVAVIVREQHHELPQWVTDRGITVVDTVAEMKAVVRDNSIHTVIISDEWYYSVYNELYELIPSRLRFYQLTNFWELMEESIPIYATREIWFLENLNRGPNRGYHLIKRIVDVLAVILFTPIFLPLGVLTAVAVKLSSPGPAFFAQTRVGRNDQPFTLYKFRSMRTDAEKDGVAQWATENDPRITAVGRVIRATRLDEIPQVINVFRGEMSFIGPRPERPEFVSTLSRSIPHYHLRHLVKPGLTGWAQVRYRYGASEEDAAIKLTYDLYYVKNVSFVLDVKILLKTIMTVLGRRGR
ncbi:MAG TPA: sugar transferase [Alkalispirochaeta sp.]|nr:sugar transferase [Alkalispirochaeta sp.]